jgi:hypothetical protein
MDPAVARVLDQIEIGAPTTLGRLTLWPLLPKTRVDTRLKYRLLGEALVHGDVVVEEISDTGSVPNVRVRNLCDEALLVLFGEELRGAKQNRIANASFLVPPKGEIVIDVSCVEAGRWHSTPSRTGARSSPMFDEAGSVVSQSLRRQMTSVVADSRASGHGFHADQSAVWEEISERLTDSGTNSSSSAYSDYVEARSERLTKARAAFAPQGVGFVAAVDGVVTGMEVIGEAAVYARSFARLLDAYLIDAVEDAAKGTEDGGGAIPQADPAAFLAKVREAPATTGPSLGLGEDLRLRSAAVEGAALVAGEVVHLTAAPWQAETRRPRGRRERFLDSTSDFVPPFDDSIDFRRGRRGRDVA